MKEKAMWREDFRIAFLIFKVNLKYGLKLVLG